MNKCGVISPRFDVNTHVRIVTLNLYLFFTCCLRSSIIEFSFISTRTCRNTSNGYKITFHLVVSAILWSPLPMVSWTTPMLDEERLVERSLDFSIRSMCIQAFHAADYSRKLIKSHFLTLVLCAYIWWTRRCNKSQRNIGKFFQTVIKFLETIYS